MTYSRYTKPSLHSTTGLHHRFLSKSSRPSFRNTVSKQLYHLNRRRGELKGLCVVIRPGRSSLAGEIINNCNRNGKQAATKAVHPALCSRNHRSFGLAI